MSFTHLHVHSEYSLLDGYGKPEQYAARAAEIGFSALALTDHGNVDGAIKWQKACEKAGISPIIGCELYVVPDMAKKEKGEKRGHLTVLVKDLTGWQCLLRLLTRANIYGFYSRPRIDYKAILGEEGLSGLMFLTGCASSFLLLPGGRDFLDEMRSMNLAIWLEVMPHRIESQERINRECLRLHSELKLPLVVTNDCHYVMEDQAKVQEVLLAVQRNNAKWTDPKRFRFGFEGLHLRTPLEMETEFDRQGILSRRQYLVAMMNTGRIAQACQGFRIPKMGISLPPTRYEKNALDMTADEILNQFAQVGFKGLFGGRWLSPDYAARYSTEMEVIRERGFARYFLVIYELVEWCRENGIGIGPGRGSVGGSLIAYLLRITKIDPLKYGLMFERFISMDRIDYPDVDLDFERDKTHLVREHLEKEYGQYNVAGISTFQKMKNKAAIRDVGRVFEVPYVEVDRFAKVISGRDKEMGSIARAGKSIDEGRAYASRHPEEFALACALEGQVRNAGQHPAGLIVSGEDLRLGGRCNLALRKNVLVTNWDMNDCEHVGLMKIDILKLATLSILSEAERAIREMDAGFDLDKIPLDDAGVFKMLSGGDTVGVFQLSGYASRKLCSEMGIGCFDDIAAVGALARPGPSDSGMTADYVRRKKGEKWEPIHSIYEEITASTYGVLAYQEQIIQALVGLAGMTPGDADRVRKIIGKKRDPKEFEEYRLKFVDGCRGKKTLTEGQAEKFWSGLLNWAQYGFNKCLSGDSLLIRSSYNQYTGKYISLKDLYLNWHQDSSAGGKYRSYGLQVMQMGDDRRCRPGRIIGIFYNGKRKVFEIKTQTGKRIKGTVNHRLFTYDGYKTIEELKIEDRLAVMGGFQASITERKGQKWRKTNTKGKHGFQKGKENPAYIDGRQRYLDEAKEIVLARSNGVCERCKVENSLTGYQFSHIISPVKEFDYDYKKYHSPLNILYLCISCHSKLDYEKGERKRRYNTGYPIYYDPIISIEFVGQEDVFDVEMEGPNHNFIANGIVSHNSHSVEYGLIGYQTAWLKLHYPVEFFCSALTYGEEDRAELLAEINRAGFGIRTPKVGLSDAKKWIFRDSRFYMPFVEIKGIGETQAEKCCGMKREKTLKGFFDLKTPVAVKGKLGALLERACVYDPDAVPEDCIGLFGYDVRETPSSPIIVAKKKMEISPALSACDCCPLRKQAGRVVPPSLGIYNALILGEAPGREENERGIGFVGPASKPLWDGLAGYGVNRRMVHVSNVCHCWPSQNRGKTPQKAEIDECFGRWGIGAIRAMDCRLIFALGNSPLYALTGKENGIMRLSGSMEWIGKVGAHVVWGVHPSAVLRRRENESAFNRGIESFARILREKIDG